MTIGMSPPTVVVSCHYLLSLVGPSLTLPSSIIKPVSELIKPKSSQKLLPGRKTKPAIILSWVIPGMGYSDLTSYI